MFIHLLCPSCGTKNRILAHRLGALVDCGRCHQHLLGADPLALSDTHHQAFLSQTEVPVIMDFWAQWCGPCRSFAPVFSQACHDLSKIIFAKVNSDSEIVLSQKFKIQSIPTLVMTYQGNEITRISGAMNLSHFKHWIELNLPDRQFL